MNEASEWRIALAHDLAAHYAPQPGVRMIVAGGSAARGQADAYSDIDLIVYWERVDAGWLASAPLGPAGGARFTFRAVVEGTVYLEQYFIGDLKLDVAHIALAWWEDLASAVLERADTADEKQDTLAGFMLAAPLYGGELYAQWRARLAAYPDALARRMVEQHLFFYPLWVLEQHGLARGDIFSFYDLMCGAIKRLVGVLAGINRVYVSTEHLKRVGDIVRSMPIRPPGAAERIESLLTIERAQAPAALGALIAETLDLVEARMPEVDIGRARRAFGFTVRACDARPEFPRSQQRQQPEAQDDHAGSAVDPAQDVRADPLAQQVDPAAQRQPPQRRPDEDAQHENRGRGVVAPGSADAEPGQDGDER